MKKGSLTLSNSSNNITYNITGEAALTKGDIITLNLTGTEGQYRILSKNGAIVKCIGMSSIGVSQFNSSGNSIYSGSTLDTFLNTTWYNSLTSTAKNALVLSTITQDSWSWYTAGNPIYFCKSNYYGNYKVSLWSNSYGPAIQRYIYAPSYQDIIDYLNATPSMDFDNTTLTDENILAVNNLSGSGVSYLTRSDYGHVGTEVAVIAGSGRFGGSSSTDSFYVMPLFSIDLSKISYSKFDPATVKNILMVSAINSSVTVEYQDSTTEVIANTKSILRAKRIISCSYSLSSDQGGEIFDPDNNCVASGSGTTIDYTLPDNGYTISVWSYEPASCIAADTQVEMGDGTFKNLGDIEVGDEVLSIDFNTMKLVTRKVIYSGKDDPNYEQGVTPKYIENIFSDGTIIKQAMNHRFYKLEDQSYKYMKDWTSGEHSYNRAGENPTLITRRLVEEPLRYARITLEDSNNYFANGLSTGDRYCPTGIVLDKPLSR